MEMKYNIEYHIADVIYNMLNEISLLKKLVKVYPKSNNVDTWKDEIFIIDKYMNRITKTEEYKKWIKEAQAVPNLDETDKENISTTEEFTDELIYTDKINDEIEKEDNSIFHEMSKKSKDGWVGIEDYIDEVIKRKIDKYMPDWYKERYYRPIWVDPHYNGDKCEKIPYWLRPDYNPPQPTCWKENTEMFKIHPESGPIYTDRTYTSAPNRNLTTVTC